MELSSKSLQTVNAKATLEARRTSRNLQRCGLDATVLAYIVLHGSAILLLLSSHTNLGHRFSGKALLSPLLSSGPNAPYSNPCDLAEALKVETGFPNAHQVYVGFVVLCLILHTWLFTRLHRSDPGWIQCPSKGLAASSNVDLGMSNICNHCGAVAALRSRHDFNTGARGAFAFAKHL